MPAAYSGVYAFANVVRMELPPGTGTNPEGMPWHQTAALATNAGGFDAAKWDLLGGHVWCQGVATLLAALLVTVGFGASDAWRQRLHWPLIGGLAFCAVAMGWGAYYGGEMVYRHGVGTPP